MGDPVNANIKVGTWLIVPGGQYQYHTPGQIGFVSRTSPATAQVGGPGACPPTNSSAAGTGTFVYPTDRHYLSGYNYDVKTNHLAIDLAANLGDNIYASDGGVIVYRGWNNYGYGNMIMIDHGNGFQTLYAHLSQMWVGCGAGVKKVMSSRRLAQPAMRAGRTCTLKSATMASRKIHGTICRRLRLA